MSPQVAHGKALVAKLRAQAGVRDPEALAAYLGRFKKARKSGLSLAQAKKVAMGKSAKQKTGGSSSLAALPKTADEAADLRVAALIDAGDTRLAGDKDLQAKVRENFVKAYGASIAATDAKKRSDVEDALKTNAANPRLSKVQARFGKPGVVFKKYDDSLDSRDQDAAAYQDGPTTVIIQNRDWTWPNTSKSNITLGEGSVNGGVADVLRHEYGHYIENLAEHRGHPIDKAEFRKLLPDKPTLKKDLSYYAGIAWGDGDDREPFAELVSVVTAQQYKHQSLPKSIQPAAAMVERILGL